MVALLLILRLQPKLRDSAASPRVKAAVITIFLSSLVPSTVPGVPCDSTLCRMITNVAMSIGRVKGRAMKVVVTAFRLLEEVARTQPAGVSALARSLGLPKSTVQRGLLALKDAGWIAASGDDMTHWVLTTRALMVGSNVGGHIFDRRAARAAMQVVNDATDEAIHLVVLDEDEVVIIERVECKLPVRTYSQVGVRAPLHTTANGKAILAAMDIDAFETYLANRTLEARTPMSIVTIGELRAEVERIRAQGYAVSRRENRDDVAAVGAAIRGADGRPVGGLSISAPAHRVTDDLIPGYGELVASAARSLRA